MNLMRMKSLVLFELPFDYNEVCLQFTTQHQRQLSRFPAWSLAGTKKQIISRYWFNDVILNYFILFGLALLSTIIFTSRIDFNLLPASLVAGFISFIAIFITNYWPSFYLDFLPKLDALMEQHQRKEKFILQQQFLKEVQEKFGSEYDFKTRQTADLLKKQQQIELLQREFPKCKKAQLPTLTLVLILYVLSKTSGIDYLQSTDQCAALLTKLFGKDPGAVKDCLQLIYGKKQELSMRQRTEIQNRFGEAYSFFEELGFQEGISQLQKLEPRFSAFAINPK